MLKRILTTLMMVLSASICGLADTPNDSGLTIRSTPAGAEAILEGDARITGITPTTIKYPLLGKYKLSVRRPGYETFSTTLLLDPARAFEIDIELNPKSRFKAALRSMVFPGWGQRYAERSSRGNVFTFLFAVSATAFAITEKDFNDKIDEHDRRLAELNEADPLIESSTRMGQLVDAANAARAKAYDAETKRRITLGAVAGVWGIALLDALLFSPDHHQGIVSLNGLSLAPAASQDGVQLSLIKSF